MSRAYHPGSAVLCVYASWKCGGVIISLETALLWSWSTKNRKNNQQQFQSKPAKDLMTDDVKRHSLKVYLKTKSCYLKTKSCYLKTE